jgi:hypothetical protein
VQPSLPTGALINSGTGIISGLRTTVSNNTNYTIRATNVSGFTERIINLAFNLSFGTINKSSATTINSDGSPGLTFYGFRKRTHVITIFGSITYPAFGSLTNERFNTTNIEVLDWTYNEYLGYYLELLVAGNVSGSSFTLTLGNQNFSSSSTNQYGGANGQYVNDQFYYGIPVTLYSWALGSGQFSYFQNTSPLQYKII